jgi:hypothetical protein
MTDESAADRLEKDPRPKGEAVPRGPPARAEDETPAATPAPGTEAQDKVRPKETE